MHEIVEKKVLADVLTKYVVRAPYVAKKCKAGNFVIIRLNECGERIPLTIVDADADNGTITLIVQAVGKTTRLLSKKLEGDFILDVAGPLGRPTPIAKVGTVVCVGGGVGTAEVFPIAKALKKAGNNVVTIIGARTRGLVILENELREISDKLFIVTDDGSYGSKGFVTDALGQYFADDGHAAEVFAIGPLAMMKAVSMLTLPLKVKTYVSLNALMVDGTGMCGGCRVTVGGKMQFACIDGPEFNGHEVDFDELMFRTQSYSDMERSADEQLLAQNHSLVRESHR